MYRPLFSNQSVMHDKSWPQWNRTAAVAVAVAFPSYFVPRWKVFQSTSCSCKNLLWTWWRMMYFLTFYLLYNQVKYAFTPILPGSQKVSHWMLSLHAFPRFAVQSRNGTFATCRNQNHCHAVKQLPPSWLRHRCFKLLTGFSGNSQFIIMHSTIKFWAM